MTLRRDIAGRDIAGRDIVKSLLHDLPTPAAVVDRTVLERNCQRMAQRATRLRVRLRPHVKTHKCVEIGRLQTAGHFGGVTVSTVAEARAFVAAGFSDITYAFPLAPSRIPEVAELAAKCERFAVLLDQSMTVEALVAHGARFEVFLKVNCGTNRAGVDPQSPSSVALARHIADQPTLEFRGILAHAGHAYAARNGEEILSVAEEERRVTDEFAGRLRAVGLPVNEVSVGSTPTCTVAEDWSGVTEIRPGNYAFHDLYQRAIGTCRLEDIAQFVLATIVAVYPERHTMILDAGALALSQDPGARHVDGESGFGLLASCDGSETHHALRIHSLSQEHGVVRWEPDATPPRYRVGDRVRVLPNHSCLTAALHDAYHVLDGEHIVDRWHPVRGW